LRTTPLRQVSLVLMFWCACNSHAQQFEVDGQISFSTGDIRSRTYFRAVVNDQKWYINLTEDSKTNYDYKEISFDGKYCYCFTSLKSYVEEHQKRGEKVGANIATGWIVKESFYRSIFAHEAGPIWLAYASRYFFNNLTNKLIEPVISLNCERIPPSPSSPSTLAKQRIDWDLEQNFPYLPKTIVFYDDGVRIAAPFRKRQPPFDNGFTNIVFRVLESTNLSGMVLPTVVTLNVACPRQGELGLLYSYRISNVNILTKSIENSFVPVIPGQTHVTDGRFRSEAGLISYEIETNWLSEGEVRSFPQFGKGKIVTSIIKQNAPVKLENGKIWLIRIFFIISVLSATILIWRSAIKK